MARFRLDLEYEGTRYRGWQVQHNARTVAGEILGALQRIPEIRAGELMGSGRTDAGVHALHQTAHLDAQMPFAPEVFARKLNDLLPQDIHVLRVAHVHHRFHARHHAVWRSYLYQVSRRRTALGKRFVWWVKDSLDVEAMRSAAGIFVGSHDFRSFTDTDPDEKSTLVSIEETSVQEAGDLVLIRVRGSHFLWKMVRRMVGVLVEVGRGRSTSDDIERYLESGSEEPARFTAPPSGLFLERVQYQGDTAPPDIAPMITVR